MLPKGMLPKGIGCSGLTSIATDAAIPFLGSVESRLYPLRGLCKGRPQHSLSQLTQSCRPLRRPLGAEIHAASMIFVLLLMAAGPWSAVSLARDKQDIGPLIRVASAGRSRSSV